MGRWDRASGPPGDISCLRCLPCPQHPQGFCVLRHLFSQHRLQFLPEELYKQRKGNVMAYSLNGSRTWAGISPRSHVYHPSTIQTQRPIPSGHNKPTPFSVRRSMLSHWRLTCVCCASYCSHFSKGKTEAQRWLRGVAREAPAPIALGREVVGPCSRVGYQNRIRPARI